MAKKRLDPTQSSEMIFYARRDPEQVKTSITNDAFRLLELNDNPTLVSVT